MNKRSILGLTERIIIITPEGREEKVTARIDTGATGSSMDIHLAANLRLSLMSKMKLVKSASGVKRRPTIHAKVKLESQTIDEEFTITDRSHMTYPVLIGQNILKKGNFLIDPHKEGYS